MAGAANVAALSRLLLVDSTPVRSVCAGPGFVPKASRSIAETAQRATARPRPGSDVTHATRERVVGLGIEREAFSDPARPVPLGVHTGDQLGDQTGDHVRADPLVPQGFPASRARKGDRWCPRLLGCESETEH